MKLFDILILVLALSTVWDILFDRSGFSARVISDKVYALSVCAFIWFYAVQALRLPPGVEVLLTLPCIAAFAFSTWAAAKRLWTSWHAHKTKPEPRMSAHELMSLYEDIAKADRLRASGIITDRLRASELMEKAVAQAARHG